MNEIAVLRLLPEQIKQLKSAPWGLVTEADLLENSFTLSRIHDSTVQF